MKHLKTLGLAALAVVALTGIVGISPAAGAEFHGPAGGALSGEQTTSFVYSLAGQKVTCNVAQMTGTAPVSGHSPTLALHPEFSVCTAFGIPGNINTAGCQFNFTANLNTVNLTGCTNGIEIDSSNAFSHCHANIPNQNGINGVSFSNMGSTGEGSATMTITFAATNIHASVNVDNGLCPLTIGFYEVSSLNGVLGVMGPAGSSQTHIN